MLEIHAIVPKSRRIIALSCILTSSEHWDEKGYDSRQREADYKLKFEQGNP